jgi:hypothetical protein
MTTTRTTKPDVQPGPVAGPAIRIGTPGTVWAAIEINVFPAGKGTPDEGAIHLTTPAVDGFHSTVNNVPGSARYHPNLYKHLRDVLVAAGKWQEDL